MVKLFLDKYKIAIVGLLLFLVAYAFYNPTTQVSIGNFSIFGSAISGIGIGLILILIGIVLLFLPPLTPFGILLIIAGLIVSGLGGVIFLVGITELIVKYAWLLIVVALIVLAYKKKLFKRFLK